MFIILEILNQYYVELYTSADTQSMYYTYGYKIVQI